jgi:uncharacterized membrane protein
VNLRVPVLSIALTLFFLIGSFFLVFIDTGEKSIYASQEYTDEERILVERTINFLSYETETLDFYTPNERSHLHDVRELLVWLRIIFVALIAILAGEAANHFRRCWKKKQCPCKPLFVELFKWGGISTLAIVALIALLAFTNFTTFWHLFHYPLFPQGNWVFPSESMLITLFPESFFLGFATHVLLASGAFAVLSIIASRLLKR